MNNDSAAVIEIRDLVHRYGRSDAVNRLSLQVKPGVCYGFFGRNGAGKTTTIKCLLNLLRPASGSVRVFGLDPHTGEAQIKTRIAYVPDFVAFYPWMNVRDTLDYQASFRTRWNRDIEQSLLKQFNLDPKQPSSGLSKGQRTQLALIGAIAAEPEMLILDEPTSGLDPLVRREFIQTVIGAYQDADPGRRTVFVSTHLITEFEGLIDRFTIIDQGQEVLTANSDDARASFRRLRVSFAGDAPDSPIFQRAKSVKRNGRFVELIVNGNGDEITAEVQALKPTELAVEALTLEEVFMESVRR